MNQPLAENRFYTFNQNNSGGSFRVDDRVAHYVIIEAQSAHHANEIAESIGIYFNGCEDGIDCPCCGNRWRTPYENGEETPSIYGEDIRQYVELFAKKGQPYCHVYYLDGTKKTYRK